MIGRGAVSSCLHGSPIFVSVCIGVSGCSSLRSQIDNNDPHCVNYYTTTQFKLGRRTVLYANAVFIERGDMVTQKKIIKEEDFPMCFSASYTFFVFLTHISEY